MSEQNNNPEEANLKQATPTNGPAEFLAENTKLIFGLLGGLVIAFGAYTGLTSYSKSQEMAAQSSLFKIEKEIEFFEEGLKKDSKKRTDLNFEESYAGFAQKMETFIKDNSDKKAALRASLSLASLYNEFGMSDKAAGALDIAKPELKAEMLNVLFFTQKLTSLIDTGSFDQATALADNILNMKELDFTHAVAKLKKAIALDAKGEKDEAKALYKQVSSDYPEHPAGQTARQYLRLLN